jgi:Flp pilus assembly protein TadD
LVWLAALAITLQVLGPEHPDQVVPLNALGGSLRAQGRYAQATTMFERAAKIIEKTQGPDHPAMAANLFYVATVDPRRLRSASSLAALERAVAISEGSSVSHSEDALDARFALAKALVLAGRDPSRARQLAEAADEGYARVGGDFARKRRAIQRWLKKHPPV